MGWKVPLRRGRKKNQSSHLVDSGISKPAPAKTKQKGATVIRKRPVMQTIFIVALFNTLLLMLLGGFMIKWCSIIPQMKKISSDGIRKFVMHAQNTQILSSIGRKHLQLVFPSQFVSTVEVNMSGIAGRMARAQQTRITRDHLCLWSEIRKSIGLLTAYNRSAFSP